MLTRASALSTVRKKRTPVHPFTKQLLQKRKNTQNVIKSSFIRQRSSTAYKKGGLDKPIPEANYRNKKKRKKRGYTGTIDPSILL